MPVHPQIVEVLAAMAATKLRPTETLTPPEARAQQEAVAKARNAAPTPVGAVEEQVAQGPAGPIPVRFYRPAGGRTDVPVVVYFHGGGHVAGSLDTHDAVARNLCVGTDALVVSVDYRLGPEHKFPAAVDDAFAALRWAHANAPALGADPGRIAVAGDSAGANLAAVTALMARDAGGPALCLQVLVYPVSDYRLVGGSYDTYATGYGMLTREAMHWFRRHYLSDVAEAGDWRASPVMATSLAGLPPAVVVIAEYDVLHDDDVRYVEALRAAGVQVDDKEYPGMIHGFFGMVPMVDGAVEAQRDVIGALRAAFGSAPVAAQ